jgi:hypothetical protein
MTVDKTRMYAARLHNHNHIDHPVLISPDTSDSRTFYWFQGPSRSSDTYDILRIYTLEEYARGKSLDLEEVEREFTKEFNPIYPATEIISSGGWIAPNGDFYPCDYLEHNNTARHISLFLGIDGWLEDAEWAHISYYGFVHVKNDTYTQRQLNTLGEIAVVSKDNFLTHLIEEIKNANLRESA